MSHQEPREQQRQAAREYLDSVLGPLAADQLEQLADQVAGWSDPVAALLANPMTPDQQAAVSRLLEVLAHLPPDLVSDLASDWEPSRQAWLERRSRSRSRSRAAAPPHQREA